ncbi:hypothetical protein BTW08_12635 [Salinicola sp. MH3R3-1]|uniref:hypothetical protein n=1 Tax=Salinicola sp. MH3R3-1 TaxID=1928762 RepID=UPI00094E16BF|nr:hypothetical protein [Salinicola sp. MH3R3-1]OLO07597.1 hypothetical protein BTW08_12635 [Salinicola sp. MH3R3-1]
MSHPPVTAQTACRYRALSAGLLSILLTGCSQTPISFLDPQGPVATAQRHQFGLIIALTSIVVLPVLILTPWIVIRYRYGAQSAYRPRWGFSKLADIAIWGIPFLVVVVLATVAWRSTLALDPYRPIQGDQKTEPLRVQVVGFDWKWLFIYPDQGIATVNELVVPAHRPLALELTSASVMQGFFIPALGSQIDVMNRMVTQLHLEADHIGEFPGKNMQYNGKGFSHQRFVTRVVDEQTFHNFVAHTGDDGMTLDARMFDRLMAQNTGRTLAQSLARADVGSNNDGDGKGRDDDAGRLRFGHLPDDLFSDIVDHVSPDWSSISTESAGVASDVSGSREARP